MSDSAAFCERRTEQIDRLLACRYRFTLFLLLGLQVTTLAYQIGTSVKFLADNSLYDYWHGESLVQPCVTLTAALRVRHNRRWPNCNNKFSCLAIELLTDREQSTVVWFSPRIGKYICYWSLYDRLASYVFLSIIVLQLIMLCHAICISIFWE
jgi:hypothetical protein